MLGGEGGSGVRVGTESERGKKVGGLYRGDVLQTHRQPEMYSRVRVQLGLCRKWRWSTCRRDCVWTLHPSLSNASIGAIFRVLCQCYCSDNYLKLLLLYNR